MDKYYDEICEDYPTEIYAEPYEEDKWIYILKHKKLEYTAEKFVEKCVEDRMYRVLQLFLSKHAGNIRKSTFCHIGVLEIYWRNFTCYSVVNNMTLLFLEYNFSFKGMQYIISGFDQMDRLFTLYKAGVFMMDVHKLQTLTSIKHPEIKHLKQIRLLKLYTKNVILSTIGPCNRKTLKTYIETLTLPKSLKTYLLTSYTDVGTV